MGGKLQQTVTQSTTNHVKNLTLYQAVPSELHSTFFFKVFQNLNKKSKLVRDLSADKIKSALFMVFFIEGNTKWAVKLNNQLRKCHELIGGNSRSNLTCKELTETGDFLDAFIAIAEEVEQSYNFEEEIKAKKD